MEGKSPSRQDALAHAEHWHVRLMAPDCTIFERRQFQRWRSVPENAAAYAATEHLWHSLGQLTHHPELEQLSKRILTATSEPRRHSRALLTAAAASVVLALLGGAAWFSVRPAQPTVAVYASKHGERATVTLADRSQMVLNSATEVEVSYGNDFRRVTVREGEALFSVVHDEKRPFKVIAGDGEVTALGTRFQVRREAEQITITLLDGRIVVDRGQIGEHLQLKPRDQVRFAVTHRDIAQRTIDPQVAASWSTGRLRFRSTPLAEALEEVNRYSETQIRVNDPALARRPISGTFEIGDSASVVSALEALLPVQSVQTNDADGPDVTLIVPRRGRPITGEPADRR